MTKTPRYIVRPVADANCDSLDREVILATDSLDEARETAGNASYSYGAGIEDTETGEIDVGFGFGVRCPDFNAE